eukprot:m.825890 g.825890  ORF g.825890 m.825890 type:complete len:700 (+) comp23409_c0_seq2:282-2381(+)
MGQSGFSDTSMIGESTALQSITPPHSLDLSIEEHESSTAAKHQITLLKLDKSNNPNVGHKQTSPASPTPPPSHDSDGPRDPRELSDFGDTLSPKSDVPASPSANCQDQNYGENVQSCSSPAVGNSTSGSAILSSPTSDHSSENGDDHQDRDFPATPPESCNGDEMHTSDALADESIHAETYSSPVLSPSSEGADKADTSEIKICPKNPVLFSDERTKFSVDAPAASTTSHADKAESLSSSGSADNVEINSHESDEQCGSFDALQHLLVRTLDETHESNDSDRSREAGKGGDYGSCESSDAELSTSTSANEASTFQNDFDDNTVMSVGNSGISSIARGNVVAIRSVCLSNQRKLEMHLERLRARTAEQQLRTKVWLAQRAAPSFTGLRAVPESSTNPSVVAASARVVHGRIGSFLQHRKRTNTGRTVRHAARMLDRELHSHERDMDADATDSSSCASSESELEDELQPAHSGKKKNTAKLSGDSRRESMNARQKRRKIQRDWDGFRSEVGWRWRWLDVRLNSIDQQIKEHESLRLELRNEKPPLLDADPEGGCARARGFDNSARLHRSLVRKHVNPSLQAHNTFRTVSAPLVHCDRIAICARAAMRDRGFHLVLSLPSDAPESVLNGAREHRRKLRMKMSQQLKASKAQAVAEHNRSAQNAPPKVSSCSTAAKQSELVKTAPCSSQPGNEEVDSESRPPT